MSFFEQRRSRNQIKLERHDIKDQFQDGSAAFTLPVSSPDLRKDRGSDDPNDGSSANNPPGAARSIPVVLVEKSAEGTWAFDGRMFGSGVAVRLEECCDQRVEGLELMVGDDEGLDGVEFGPDIADLR